ncbi:MAG: alpha/beta fold hydrolase [Thermoleophilaceae bacterium]
MSSVGGQDTIVRYPDLIEALVAAGNDPIASTVNLAELRATISPLGFRRSFRVHPDELQRLTVPTLLLWGDHDPVGALKVAHATARLVPDAQLEVLPAGHVPYLATASECPSSCPRSSAQEAIDDRLASAFGRATVAATSKKAGRNRSGRPMKVKGLGRALGTSFGVVVGRGWCSEGVRSAPVASVSAGRWSTGTIRPVLVRGVGAGGCRRLGGRPVRM